MTKSRGTYQTQTVRGQRASSTSDPRRAVVALTHKLWTDRAATVTELRAKGLRAGVSVWRLSVEGS